MSAYDIRKELGKDVQQSARDVQWEKIVDFSKMPTLSGATSGDILTTLTLRKGFIYTRFLAILLTAEGSAGTISVGISGTPLGFLDAGSANGTPNAVISSGAGNTIAAGTLFSANTDVILTANAALAHAKVKLIFIGHLIDLP